MEAVLICLEANAANTFSAYNAVPVWGRGHRPRPGGLECVLPVEVVPATRPTRREGCSESRVRARTAGGLVAANVARIS